ncbi:OmpA family protein [Archangium primigenium]|uniref:OmpA family protein n=1 Tax=[Archangium] primigenium TaxID=2792470 RepID=UPI00195CF034|nr:OmpA family protein [Archangium primigenium]MBM7116148.1 OmpA family protein [Archangium primigenium]
MSLPSSTRGAIVAVSLGCSLASAQSNDQLPGFELERLETNTGRGTVLVGNGELMVPSGLSVSLLGHYQSQPLVLNNGEKNLDIVQHRATAMLSASYGVLSWLELGAQLPFVLWQQGKSPTDVGLAELRAQGLGTPVLQARLGVLSRRRRQPLDLAADLGIGLPIGTGSALAGDDGPRFHARMVAGTEMGWLHPSLEVGVLFRPNILLPSSPQTPVREGASSEIRLAAALATTGQGLRGELGMRATFAQQPSLELLGGARFPLISGLDAFLLGGPGIGAAPGTPRFRVVAGISFRNEPPPKIAFLDERSDQELQLVLANPERPTQEKPVRPVPTWDIALGRGEEQGPLAAAAEPLPTAKPHQPGEREKVVLRGEIHFSQGSADLPGVVPLLDQAVLRLSDQARAGVILVEGHSDKDRADSFTAVRRAQAIRRYLIDQGVPATRVRIQGFGADWPVSAQPATEQERQLNRRAEVLVITDAAAEPLTTQQTPP